MDTFTSRDGLKLAYQVDDFTDPWRKPDTLLLLHAAMGDAQRWFSGCRGSRAATGSCAWTCGATGSRRCPRPRADFSLAQLVGDAVELLDLVGAEQRAHRGQLRRWLRLPATRDPPSGARQNARALRLDARPQAQPCADLDPEDRQVGLKRFLADTIDERFDQKADPELVNGSSSRPGPTILPLSRASYSTCARMTSWRN